MKNINIIFLIIICLFCNGCVGFINGYMADSFDNQEMKKIQVSYFPAINSDSAILVKNYQSEDFNSFQKVVFTTVIGIDYPISACVDIIFLPFKGLAYTIHDKQKIKNKEKL